MRVLVSLLLVACSKPVPLPELEHARESSLALATAVDFIGMDDRVERSQALFAEMGKVLKHPRCANCHPSDDRPRQGMHQAVHEPPVWRGPNNHGAPGMQCDTCHQEANQDHTRIPGAPHWQLAPIEMAWLGRSLGQICTQIKDPERNGERGLEDLYTHMSEDALVGWAWEPGGAREPAPGTQVEFAALIRAWINSGAHCPVEAL